jgi:hypothetical protein
MVDVRNQITVEELDRLRELTQVRPDKELLERNVRTVTEVARVTGQDKAAETIEQNVANLPDDTIVDITEDMVARSTDLQRDGALPGDKIVNGNLRRLVSEEPRGRILTASDIAFSTDLKADGAEPGDMIADGELIKSGENDPYRNIMYDYEKSAGLMSNMTDYLNSQFPLPEFTFNFTDPLNFIDIHFDDPTYQRVLEMSPQERRDFFIEQKEQKLADMRQNFEPTGSIIGTIAGSVDPTLLYGLTARGLNAIAVGLGFGGAFEASEQLAKTGTINKPVDVAESALIGGVAVPVASAVIGGGQRLYGSLSKPVRKKNADKAIDSVNKIVEKELALGKPASEAIETAKTRLNLSDQKLAEFASLSGKPIGGKPASQKAEEIINDELANDSVLLQGQSKKWNDFLNVVSTEVAEVSPKIGAQFKRFQAELQANTGKNMQKALPFIDEMKKLNNDNKKLITMHLNNRNYQAAKDIASKYSSRLAESIDDVKEIFNQYGDEIESAFGVELNRKDFFSRSVHDLDGLLKEYSSADRNTIQQAFKDVAKSKGKSVEELTDPERANILNKVVQGYKITYVNDKLNIISPATKAIGKGKGVLAPRNIETVTPEMMKYYDTADVALAKYIRRTTDSLAKQKFLGKSNVFADGIDGVNIPDSLGAFLNKELREGNITENQVERLTYLFNARFGAGEQGIGEVWTGLRDLGYLGTIADPLSALVQITDLAASGALFGFRNTLRTMFGQKRITIADAALERVSAEMSESPRLTGKVLDAAFTATGFRAIDRLGKETIMNSALARFEKLAKTPKGKDQIRKDYADFLGKDLEATIANLENKVLDDNIKAMAINELSNLQPITNSELAVAYLANADPTTRLLYMLKSFTVKQYDLVRREIYNKIKEGKYIEAARMTVALGSAWAVAGASINTVKDLLLNREVRPEEIPNSALWSLLGIFGINKYTSERYLARRDVKGAVINYIVPATPIIDAAVNRGYDALVNQEVDIEELQKDVKVLPGGDIIYNWFLGGAEKFNEREEQKRRSAELARQRERLGLPD